MKKNELSSRVENWLKTQGYPLEMRVANFFHKRGWFFHHARQYRDLDTEKEQEIDLMAFYDDRSKESPIHIHFVIQCVWSLQKPWILFSSMRQSMTPIGHLKSIPATDSAKKLIKILSPNSISNAPFFSELQEGYLITQAFNEYSAPNPAHSVVSSIINAADFFANQMSDDTNHSIIYIPTIILDGELFQCSLDDSGEIKIEETNIGFMLFDKAGAGERRSVYIVPESGLLKFIENAEQTFDYIRSKIKKAKL